MTWFAVRYDQSTFAIFDAFDDEAGRRGAFEGKDGRGADGPSRGAACRGAAAWTPEVLAGKLPG